MMGEEEQEDVWDSLLHIEEKIFQEGVEEGAQDSQQEGEVREQGLLSGFRHGFAFHMEVSFMKRMTNNILKKLDHNPIGENKTQSNGVNRMKRKCTQLLTRIDEIPENNSKEIDFLSLLKDLQSSYRSIGPNVPTFSIESLNEMDW